MFLLLIACHHQPPAPPLGVPTVSISELTAPLRLPAYMSFGDEHRYPELYVEGHFVTGDEESLRTYVETVWLSAPPWALYDQVPRDVQTALSVGSTAAILGGVFLPNLGPSDRDLVVSYNNWAAKNPEQVGAFKP